MTLEAFSRLLIDQALTDSGWNLFDNSQVRFEVSGATGRADYVLMDVNGKALCVLEAKRENLDPYDAKEQARGYAENLRARVFVADAVARARRVPIERRRGVHRRIMPHMQVCSTLARLS